MSEKAKFTPQDTGLMAATAGSTIRVFHGKAGGKSMLAVLMQHKSGTKTEFLLTPGAAHLLGLMLTHQSIECGRKEISKPEDN